MKQAFFVFFFVLFASGIIIAGIVAYTQVTREPEIPIADEFQGKIVYTTDTLVDAEALRLDCDTRGGIFNPCGSICIPGSEMCANVCAFTCEFPDQMPKVEPRVPKGWFEYISEPHMFSIQYKKEMAQHEVTQGEGGIAFTLIGPTQATGTELFDGVSISVVRYVIPAKKDFAGVVADALEEASDRGTITVPLATTTVAGRDAADFTADAFGVFRSIFVPLTERDYIRIDYTVADPGGFGYAETINRMITTFTVSIPEAEKEQDATTTPAESTREGISQ